MVVARSPLERLRRLLLRRLEAVPEAPEIHRYSADVYQQAVGKSGKEERAQRDGEPTPAAQQLTGRQDKVWECRVQIAGSPCPDHRANRGRSSRTGVARR